MSKKQSENVLMENLKLWEKNIIEDYRDKTLKKEIKEVKTGCPKTPKSKNIQ